MPKMDPIVEEEIREFLKNDEFRIGEPPSPEGELTKADLASVTELSLAGTQITDAGLKEVAKLKNLSVLSFSNTQITDAGLKEVAKLKELTELYLFGTKVTKAGMVKLQEVLNRRRRLPECYIESDFE